MARRPDFTQLAIRYFKPHALVYGIAMLLALTQVVLSVGWWLFWPLIVWTLAFLIHFLAVKSLGVSNDWVEERTDKTAMKAFDISHIETIRESYENTSSRYEKNGPDDGAEAGTGDASSRS